MTPYDTPPPEEWVLERAAEVYAEHRSLFHFGPPPYVSDLAIRHTATGQEWVLRVSVHIPDSGLDAVTSMLRSASADNDPMRLAMGLAYLQAAEDCCRIAAMAEAGGVQ